MAVTEAVPPLLDVRGLTKRFEVVRQEGVRRIPETIRAVDGINLRLTKGETLGLVGESGCGKSTAGRTILRLIEPSSGVVLFEGSDLARLSDREMRSMRRHLGIVFQDPMSALNPRMRVRDILAEPLQVHGIVRTRREAQERACALLHLVGLRADMAERYPHEFSGGQRQRIGVARAIATEPRLIILDEPISALDVSVRAQILNLLADLQEQLQPAYLLIAHDLSVVRHACDRVAVMYLGIIVEEGPSDALFAETLHPYTRALLAAAPSVDPGRPVRRTPIEGDVPTAVSIPTGCRFRTRCPIARPICAEEEPELREWRPGRTAACHFAGDPS